MFPDRAAKARHSHARREVCSRTQRSEQPIAAPVTGQRINMRGEHKQRTQRDRTNAEENPQRDHDRESISGNAIIPLQKEIRIVRACSLFDRSNYVLRPRLTMQA